jgi:hypothetical protein
MGRNFSELFAAKLARYHAAKKKAKASRTYRRRKQREKAKLRALLAMAREALGYKPLNGGLGRKLSPEHIKALREGHRLHFQAKRVKKGG